MRIPGIDAVLVLRNQDALAEVKWLMSIVVALIEKERWQHLRML
jgi:hypothetical protein